MRAVFLLIAAAVLGTSAAGSDTLVRTPELVVTRRGALETVAMPGGGYHGFAVQGTTASYIIAGQALPAGEKQLRGGISAVRWTPLGKEEAAREALTTGTTQRKFTRVELEFASAPQSTLLNAVPGTKDRPQTPQVLAGFIFPNQTGGRKAAPAATLGGRTATGAGAARDTQPGQYELPKLPPAHYSDALVSLKVYNADFRDVLFLLGQIGGVSIMLDPYYDDEPTGSTRSGKSGGRGGNDGGGGSSGPGEGFNPNAPPAIPSDNTGFVTLNFDNVPFDLALDLLLETSGLVKVDIYPKG